MKRGNSALWWAAGVAGVLVAALMVFLPFGGPPVAGGAAAEDAPEEGAARISAGADADDGGVARAKPAPDPARLRAEIEAAIASADSDGLARGLAELAILDPDAAAGLFETVPPGDLRVVAMRTLARTWAERSPEHAMKWTSSLPEEDRNHAQEFMIYRFAEDNPEGALSLAIDLGIAADAPTMQDLSQQWAARDADAAVEWVLAQPDDAVRQKLVPGVAMVLARTHPAEAGRLVAEELGAGPEQEEAAMSVLHQWAIRDFEGAAAWVATFPEGTMRVRAEEELKGIASFQSGQ